MLNIGTDAPEFKCINQKGKTIQLSDFVGKKIVVLYFYPKDFTPGCKAQACSFRDEYEQFMEYGAEVIGISADSEESHKKFAGNYSLPFHLCSDRDGTIRKSYKVPVGFLSIFFSRITYIIGLDGKIAWAYKSNLAPASHVSEALKIVEELQLRNFQ
ncbi:peroxiredoxin [Schleiferia thermophila]